MKRFTLTAFLLIAVLFGAAAQQPDIYPQVRTAEQNNFIQFSPDGKWIFGNAGIWDATTGRELKRSYNTSIVGFSPDLKRYLQGGGSTVRIRDWETDTVIATIRDVVLPTLNLPF